jgi:hypothetical protein
VASTPESDIATYLFSLMFFLGWIGGWGAEVAREAGQLPVALVPTIALAIYAAIAYVKHTRKPPSIEELAEHRAPKVSTLSIAQLGDLPIGLPFAAVVVATLSVETLRSHPVGSPPSLFGIVLLGSLICAIPPAYALAAVLWRHRARTRGALEPPSPIEDWRRAIHAFPPAPSVPAVRSTLYVFAALVTLGASAGLTLAAVHRLGWATLLMLPVPVAGALFAIRSYGSALPVSPAPSVPASP